MRIYIIINGDKPPSLNNDNIFKGYVIGELKLNEYIQVGKSVVYHGKRSDIKTKFSLTYEEIAKCDTEFSVLVYFLKKR